MNVVLTFAVTLALVASSAFAGITYRFNCTSSGTPTGGALSGRAAVEPHRARVDVEHGDGILFHDNSVVLSQDGGQTLLILNPADQTYFELHLDQLLGGIGAVAKSGGGMFDIKFANPKVTARDDGAGPPIAGFPTRKSTVTTSYDLVIDVMGKTIRSHVDSSSQSWPTDRLSSDLLTFVQLRDIRTGIDGLDQLIATSSAAVKGFPLRQTSRTTTTSSAGGKIDMTSTMTISELHDVSLVAAQFLVPANYKKVPSPIEGLLASALGGKK